MSKEVKRYNFDVDKFGSPRAYESEHGRWVKRDDYKALLAERDAAQKDAERYRFIRANAGKARAEWEIGGKCFSMMRGTEPEEVDAAVDAALQGEQP